MFWLVRLWLEMLLKLSSRQKTSADLLWSINIILKAFSNVENDSNTDVVWLDIEISKKIVKFEFDVSKPTSWNEKRKCECLFNLAYHKRAINRCIDLNKRVKKEIEIRWWFRYLILIDEILLRNAVLDSTVFFKLWLKHVRKHISVEFDKI